MNPGTGQSNGPGIQQGGLNVGPQPNSSGPIPPQYQAVLNLHILDYLHRSGYANAAHGLEQDVADLLQRATLPLSSNMIFDYWSALFESHHARTLKPAPHMTPKFVDPRGLRASGGAIPNAPGMPPNSHAQYGQNMNYPIPGNVSGPHGQMGYAGAGQPPLPMRGSMPHGMQQQGPPPGYGMPSNVGNFPIPESKGYYASLPKSQSQGGYGMPPQSPTGLYPPQQGPPGSMAPPQSRGYPPSNMPPSMYPGGPHPGSGMHPSYPHHGMPHTPQTPSSAPQTPVEVPPSPSGTGVVAGASSTAGSTTTPVTPNATASAPTTTTTGRRGAKASSAASSAEKPAKATATRKGTTKAAAAAAAKEAAAKEAAAAAATSPPASTEQGHQGAAHTASVPLSLPQPMSNQMMPNGMPHGMMRSITPPPQHMHNPADPNAPAGAWPPHGYPSHRWAQPSGVPQGPMPLQGPGVNPGQKGLNMSGSTPKGAHMVPTQLQSFGMPVSGHPQASQPSNHQLHSSRGSQGYPSAGMQYPLPATGVMGQNGPQEMMHSNGHAMPPHMYPGLPQHQGQPNGPHGHTGIVHSQQFAHPHMMPPQSPAGSMVPSSPHGSQSGGPPTPQGNAVQTPPAHLSSLTAGRSTPTSGQNRRPTPPSGHTSEDVNLYPYRTSSSGQLGSASHPMDSVAPGSELDDGLSMYPNESVDGSNGSFGPGDGSAGGYGMAGYGGGSYYNNAPPSSNGPQPGQSGSMVPPYPGSHPGHMAGGMPHMMDSKNFFNNGALAPMDPSAADDGSMSRKRKKPTGGFEAGDFADSSPRLSHNSYSGDPMGGAGSMMSYGNSDSVIKPEEPGYGYGASSMMDMTNGDSLTSPSPNLGLGSGTTTSDPKMMTLIDDSDASATADDNEPLMPAYTPTNVRTMADHTSKVLVCAFDSTGKYLATGGGGTDAPIRVWDVETGKVHMLLKGHIHNVTGLKWSTNPDRPSLLLSCSLDATIRLWDINNAENPELQCVRHSQSLNALDWHPNAHDRFICTDQIEQLVLWYMSNDESMEIEKLPAKCIEGVANKQVRYSPSGRFIAAGLLSSPLSVLKILDGETQKVLHEISGHDKQIIGLHWIDDSIVVSTSEDIVRVWKITSSSFECIQGFSPPGDKTYYAIPHPHSATRILIGAYQKMYDWDYYSNKSRSTQCHEGIISCLSYSAKSDLLATTSHDKRVNLWRIPSS